MLSSLFIRICIISITAWVSLSSEALAAQAKRHLIIGTKQAPPFVIKDRDGAWRGISIELWQEIARDLNIDYEFRETDLKGLIAGVQDSSFDAGIAAISVTSDREKRMDFTHPYYTSGLGIAVKPRGKADWTKALGNLMTFDMLEIVILLALGTLIMGWIVWLFERNKNPQQFGGNRRTGLGSAFWWSAVTLTTVGYGDKAPVTIGGRLVALLWMFAAIVIVAVFTATMTTALTVNTLESAIHGPEDLPHVKVGTVAGASAEGYLNDHQVAFAKYATSADGLADVDAGKIDAFVYDAPMLKYLLNSRFRKVTVLPTIFDRQYYAIALPANSPLRKSLNGSLLTRLQTDRVHEIFKQYLGE